MNAILVLFACIATAFGCPQTVDISPCKCDNNIVLCEGTQITNLSAISSKLTSPGVFDVQIEFDVLLINDTAITSIDDNAFGDAVFGIISITNNALLTKISRNAFKRSTNVHVFDVINSPKLTAAEELFVLINSLQVKQKIGLSGLGIEEIPDNAFATNPNLYVVIMDENKNLKRIGKSAFKEASNLTAVILLDNAINEIDSDGLTFSSNSQENSLVVVLNGNQLTAKSFHENWSNNPIAKNLNIMFELNANKIDTLPEHLFKNVILSPAVKHLSFGGNPFICDCGMKWVSSLKSLPNIKEKLVYVDCANKNSTNALDLQTNEFGLC